MWLQSVQGSRSLQLQHAQRPQVPRPAWVQVHWQVPLLPRLLRAQRLWPSVQLLASHGMPSPVLFSKTLAQLKLAHAQSMNGLLVAPRFAQALVSQSEQQRRPGLLLGRCLGVFHRCARVDHGHNGRVNDVHDARRCFRCCLRLRPMGCHSRRPLCWPLFQRHSVQGQVHLLGDARCGRCVHDDLHRHVHLVRDDPHAAHVLGALRCHRR